MCPDLRRPKPPPRSGGFYPVEPLAQHRRGGGTNLASEFRQGRVPPLPRPLGTLAVHEPPDARLGDPTLTKLRCHVPHEAGIGRDAGRRPGSLSHAAIPPRPPRGRERRRSCTLATSSSSCVRKLQRPERRIRTKSPGGFRLPMTRGMIRGGEEIQPAGLARGDIPRVDRLGVEVEQPRRVAEILRLHIPQCGPVGRCFGLLRFRL